MSAPDQKQSCHKKGTFLEDDCFQTEALAYLTTKLETYGSTLSDDHRLALRGLVDLAHGLTAGSLTGRFRFALPCGMGKTTGVRACLRTIAQLGLTHRVTVACSKVEQLCRLKRQLITEDGVDPELIGLVHSYAVDRKRAEDGTPGYASEPAEGEDRQFLLVTHARCRTNDEGNARPWVLGREDDLVFYDESLIVGQALTLPLLTEDGANLMGDAAAFETTLAIKPEHAPAVSWVKSAVGALAEAAAAPCDDAVRLVHLPALTEAEAASYLRLRPFATERFPRLAGFVEQARDGVTFRVFVDRTSSRSLVSYTVSVPDALRNVIVLDASDPVREIVHHDYRMIRAEDVVPCLEKFKDVAGGISSIKRYDRVRIYFANEGSGRGAMREEFARGKASHLLQKFVRLMQHKADQKALVFTFKQQDSYDINYPGVVHRVLTAADIDPSTGLDDGSGCGRVNLLTWGMETATNDYQACGIVAMLGVLHPRHDVMAGTYLGQLDNLRAPTVASLVNRLVKAECLHSIYQAANRGSMRVTEVVDGVSQAKACEVYLVHSDPELREKIEQVLPGAQWLPWREEGEDLTTTEVALKITARLDELETEGHTTISLRRLKGEVAPVVPGKTWQVARDRALKASPWLHQKGSLVRLFAPEVAA